MLFKAITIGTSGGIVFALIIGFMYSFILSELFLLIYSSKKLYNLSILLFISLLIFSTYLIVDALLYNMSHLRTDVFLIKGDVDNYQRPGAFMLIYCITLVSLAMIHSIVSNKFRFSTFLISFFISSIGFLMMLYSQLIGTNSGLVTIFSVLVVMYIVKLTYLNKNNFNAKLTIKNIIFGKIGRLYLVYSIVLLVITSIILSFIMYSYDIDISSFRIFGFGNEGFTSVNSRIEIFKNNFIEQWSYNPLFGNTIIEKLTTGEGSYVHSLLSLLTHLGIIGFCLFIVVIIAIYSEIVKTINNTSDIYQNRQYGLYRILVLTTILFFAIISAFYSWMPLWFTIGFVGVGLHMKNTKKVNN